MFGAGAIPLVGSRVRMRDGEDGELVVDTDDVTLEFGGRSARLLRKVAGGFDGARGIADLAASAGCDADELHAIVALLGDHGAVLDLAAAPDAPTPVDFAAAFGRECRFWSREILAQPFWARLMAGDAPPRVVFGWGIEFYHYVDSANEYMAAAVANCSLDHQTRMSMGRHFAEEADHGEIFLQGLAACGFPRETILDAPPLPSTRALMNFLFELACVDTVAIQATYNLMQADSERTDRDGIEAFYGALRRMYPFAAPMFDAFQKHALIDVDSKHGRTVFDASAMSRHITPEAARRCVSAVRSAADHFILFFEHIDRYYRQDDACLPRRAVDVRALW